MSEAQPTPTPRRRGRPPGRGGAVQTRATLVEAAVAGFAAAEFEQVRLADVARAAGITRPALLHHFPSKAALYAAALARCFEALGQVMRAAMVETGDHAARIESLGRSLTDFDDAHRSMLAVIFRGLVRGDEVVRGLVRTFVFPLLDEVEAYIRRSAGPRLPAGFPVRAFILSSFANEILHSMMGEFGDALWQGDANTVALGVSVARLWEDSSVA